MSWWTKARDAVVHPVEKAVNAVTDNKVVDVLKDAARSTADFSLRTMLPGIYEGMNLDDKWGLSGSNMHTGIGREFNKLAGYAGDAAPWVAAAIAAPYLLAGAGGATAATGAGYGSLDALAAAGGLEGMGGAAGINAAEASLAAQLASGGTGGLYAGINSLEDLAAAGGLEGSNGIAGVNAADKAASYATYKTIGDTLAKGKAALDQVNKLSSTQQQAQQKQTPQINIPPTNWMNLGGGTNLGDFMSQALRYGQQQDFSNMLNKKPYGYGGL